MADRPRRAAEGGDMTADNQPLRRRTRAHLQHARDAFVAIRYGDLDRLDRYFVLILPIVFASFFILPKTPQRTAIYVTCLLPMVLYLRPAVVHAVRREPVWWLTIGLCALWLVSVGWSATRTHESVFDAVRIGLTVALFVHAGIWLAIQGKLPDRRILSVLLLTAGLVGAVTIVLAVLPGYDMTEEGRLIGFGWAGHPGIGGDIYAFAGLIALVGLTQARRQSPGTILLCVVTLAVCTFYTVLSESRGAALAFVVAALLCVTLARPRHVLTLAAIVALTGLTASAAGFVDFETWITRGASHRLDIWADALAKIAANPVLGLGAADVTVLDTGEKTFNSAHNIFLAMALDLGAIGLALFIALTGLAFWRAWTIFRAGRGALLLTWLVFAYAVMMLHTQTILLMPAREWLIFWLPLLLLVQEHAACRGTTNPIVRR
jgi:O-antigen ligase